LWVRRWPDLPVRMHRRNGEAGTVGVSAKDGASQGRMEVRAKRSIKTYRILYIMLRPHPRPNPSPGGRGA